ncbi:hypothetical protein ISS05_00715 [Candidatus Woesearchaeota archaeon]|nr:hypothetical protein [Candidatus Woesearchaeota archaeon]
MASNVYQLKGFFEVLEKWGLIDILLPFLLIFTILFAVLEKTHILGADKRNLNAVLSLVFSLIVIVPHATGNYPAGYDPVQILNAALPSVSLIAVAIVMLLIMIGLFAHDKVMLGLTMPGWVALVSVITIVLIFGSAAGWYASGFNSWLESIFGSDALAIVIMLVVFGVIIAFITSGGKADDAGGIVKKMGFDFQRLFGGK